MNYIILPPILSEDPVVPALVDIFPWAGWTCSGCGGDVALPFIVEVGASVPGADAVAMRRAEASDLPLVLDGGLEDWDPLFHLSLVGGKGAGSCASRSVGSGCGGGGWCGDRGS